MLLQVCGNNVIVVLKRINKYVIHGGLYTRRPGEVYIFPNTTCSVYYIPYSLDMHHQVCKASH